MIKIAKNPLLETFPQIIKILANLSTKLIDLSAFLLYTDQE